MRVVVLECTLIGLNMGSVMGVVGVVCVLCFKCTRDGTSPLRAAWRCPLQDLGAAGRPSPPSGDSWVPVLVGRVTLLLRVPTNTITDIYWFG